MFDLGWGEILLCLGLALIVAGPEDVPRLMRHVGVFLGRMRRWGRALEMSLDKFIAQAEAETDLGKFDDMPSMKGHPVVSPDQEEDETEFYPPESGKDKA